MHAGISTERGGRVVDRSLYVLKGVASSSSSAVFCTNASLFCEEKGEETVEGKEGGEKGEDAKEYGAISMGGPIDDNW